MHSTLINSSQVIKIKLDVGKILLIFFVAIFFYIGPGAVFDHKIMHDFPYGYGASDAFQHQIRAEAIKDSGNFRYEASYISKGFENVVGRYPPIIYHLSVIFSYLSGLEIYDSIYFIVLFFAVIAVLVMYTIIADFNRNVAIMSLPLTILIFTYPIFAGFAWGHWPSLLSQTFLIVFFWSILRIDLDKSYIIMSGLITAIVMTHTSEAVFAIMFLGLFSLVRLISGNFKKSDIKKTTIAFAVSFIASAYYLIIFENTFAKGESYSFLVEPIWQGNPGFYIIGFGLLVVFIAAGVVFSLFKIKGMHVSLILAVTMLIGGFMNYIGFSLRSFQVRFFWPLYLSVLFGFGMYMIVKLIIKKWNMIYTISIFVILMALITGIIKLPFMPSYSVISSQGIMDQYHWSSLNWLSKNAESNVKIYFFYGDIYSQDALLRNSKRVHYQVDPDDFINAIKNRTIKRSYVSKLPGDNGGSLAVRTGIFTLKDSSEGKPPEFFFGPQDICQFNYIVFDKLSQQPVLAQYNLLIANDLLKKDYIKKVFENGVVVVLKNNNIGADCIEERSF